MPQLRLNTFIKTPFFFINCSRFGLDPLVYLLLTVLSAFKVVSSLEAARQPSSVEPPSHIPAKAAMLLWTHTHTHSLIEVLQSHTVKQTNADNCIDGNSS